MSKTRPRISVAKDGAWTCSGCLRTFPRKVRAPVRGGCKECRGHRASMLRLGESFRPKCSCGWSGIAWAGRGAYPKAKAERDVHEYYATEALCSCGRPELYGPHDSPCELARLGEAAQQELGQGELLEDNDGEEEA